MKLDNIIAERKTKTVYRDGDKIVKLFIEGYSKSSVLNEALNQARVEEIGIKIPKLLEVTMINSRWAIVMENIPGKTITQLIKEQPDRIYEYIDMFIDIQLKILSNKAPLLTRLKDKMKRKITETSIIKENTKYELLQRLEGMPTHYNLCHGDFNPSNVIISDNGDIYVIDWAHVTQGNASADAARTFLIFSLNDNNELAEKYLNRFSEKSGIDKKNIQRWIPIIAATQLTKENEDEKEFLEKWIDVVEY